MADNNKNINIKVNTTSSGDAKGKIDALSGSLGNSSGMVGKLSKSFVGMFNKIKVAMATNPIGLLLVAVVAIGAAVWKMVSEFEPAMDKIKQLVAPIVGAFESLKGIFQDLFSGKDVGDWTERLKEGAAAQQEIERLTISIKNQEIELAGLRSETSLELKKQFLIAKDTTKSVEERKIAVEAAMAADKKLQDAEQKNLDDKITKMKLEQSMNHTDRAGKEELAKLVAQKNKLEEKSIDTALKYQTVVKSIATAEAKAAKDAKDAKIAEAKVIQDAADAKQKLADQAIADAQKVADFELNLANKLELAKAKTTEEAEAIAFKQKQEADQSKFDKELEDLKISEEEKDALRADFNELQLTKLDEFNQAIVDKKQKENDAAKAKKEEDDNAKLEATLTRMQEDRDAIAEFDLELSEGADELEANTYAANMKKLADRRAKELQDAKDNKEAQALINSKYDKAELLETKAHNKAVANLQKAKNDVAYASLKNAASMVTSFLGDSKKEKIAALAIDKGFAIADIWMNTAVANAKSVAALPLTLGQPWVGINTASAVVGTAGVISSAVKGIGEINSASKFALGGFVDGASHTNGGTLIEAEGGEYVVRKSVMNNPEMANAIVSMNNSNGDSNATSSGLSATDIANIVISSIKSIPVVVTESSITDLQREVSVRESNL